MNQISVQALVIKVADVGESDRLITLLTRELGVIKAFASGAKKIKNKYYSGTSFLCYSAFIIEEVKDTYRVRDASLIRSYFKLGSDVEEIALQQYFCELCGELTPQGAESEDILKLLIKSITVINNRQISLQLTKAIFELRLLTVSGFMPDLVGCAVCGEFNESNMYFDYINGCIYCGECKAEGSILLSSTVVSALRHITYSEFSKLFSFSIPDTYIERLSAITERYLLTQTEHRFKTLDFYNKIRG